VFNVFVIDLIYINEKIKNLIWALVYAVSKIAYRNKWALITALVMRFTLVPLPGVRHDPAAKKKIIVLNKIGGTDDIIAAYRDSNSTVAFYLLRRNLDSRPNIQCRLKSSLETITY